MNSLDSINFPAIALIHDFSDAKKKRFNLNYHAKMMWEFHVKFLHDKLELGFDTHSSKLISVSLNITC